MPKGYPRNPKSIEERFWGKVEKRGLDECWLWQGSIHHSGYGHFGYQHKVQHAHRVAYQLTYGVIPPGIEVCHKCDVKNCVNPNHLFLGTHNDNMQDMWKKQRHPRIQDTSRWTSKLSERDVLQIRLLRQQGISNVQIAAMFHVQPSTTSRIVNGVRRKEI